MRPGYPLEGERFEEFLRVIAPLGNLPTRAQNVLEGMYEERLFEDLVGLRALGRRPLLNRKNCGRRTAQIIETALWSADIPEARGNGNSLRICPHCGSLLTEETRRFLLGEKSKR